MSSPMSVLTEDNPIYDEARYCETLFRGLLPDLAVDNVTVEAKNYHVIREHHQRFQLWTAFVGVFADPEASLDARLRDHQDVQNLVLQLLQLLKSNLARFDPSSLVDDSVQGLPEPVAVAALDAVREAIERLQRLASVIRRSSMGSLASRVKAYALKLDPGEISEFERIAFLFVKGRLDGVSESLARQLASSISFRRLKLLYVRRHHQKLATPRRDRPSDAPVLPLAQSKQERRFPISVSNFPAQNAPSRSTLDMRKYAPSHTNPSILDQSKFRKEFSKPASVLDNATVSLFGQGYSIPSPPKIEDGTAFCKCQWCACEIKASDLERHGWWSAHFQRDLEPYVCIAEECIDSFRYFSKLSEWRQHMEEAHSTDWARKIHNTAWYCDVDPGEFAQFPTADKLREHIQTQHSTMAESRITRKVTRNVLRVDRNINMCPLCNQDVLAVYDLQSNMAGAESKGKEIAENVDKEFSIGGSDRQPVHSKLDSSKSQNDERPSFVDNQKMVKHVAQHLKSLAFISIRYIDDDNSSVDSDQAAGGQNGSAEEDDDNRLLDDFPDEEGPLEFDDIPEDLRAFEETNLGAGATDISKSESLGGGEQTNTLQEPPEIEDFPRTARVQRETRPRFDSKSNVWEGNPIDYQEPLTVKEFLESNDGDRFEWDSAGWETDGAWLEPVRQAGLSLTKHKVFHHQNKEYLRPPLPFLQYGEELGESDTAITYKVKPPDDFTYQRLLALKVIVCRPNNRPPGPDSTDRTLTLQALNKLTTVKHPHVVRYVASFEDYCVSTREIRQRRPRNQASKQAFTAKSQQIKKHIIGVAVYPPAEINLRAFLEEVHNNKSAGNSIIDADNAWMRHLRSYFGCLTQAWLYLSKSEIVITHRDISLSKILIDEFAMPVIGDIGLTRNAFLAKVNSDEPIAIPKRRYIPPEIDVSHIGLPGQLSDSGLVFSLGCIFLEMASVLLGLHPDYSIQWLESHSRNAGLDEPEWITYRDALAGGVTLEDYFQVLRARQSVAPDSLMPELFQPVLKILPTIGEMMDQDPEKRPELESLYPKFRHLYDVPGSPGRCESCEDEWLVGLEGFLSRGRRDVVADWDGVDFGPKPRRMVN
ncbi:hypothetical protein QBC41DRAFT_262105 [Cercophora samala]|uniref:Protein kinase domain-containing protein n=1 Tax=Cercophora samala TaxID=330535 RepID=A0AA39YXD3_9PEZI|nr:hypothetical protein QBC41DRAFT_262105 [Cercophora samala]